MSYLTLCLDFGNTRRKAAIFENGEIIAEPELHEGNEDEISYVVDRYKPKFSILSSVISHDTGIEIILKDNTLFHKVSHNTIHKFTTPVKKPESIGADRLALAAAATHYYRGKNNLIIALGSCITYNFINQYDQFLGGSISPGKNMRFRAMNEFTDKLPNTHFSELFPLVGYDTVTNLQSGVVLGMACEIDGIINKYAEKYANFNVVLTGGDCVYFATQLKNRIFADFNFLFKGLYALSEINNKR